MPKLKNITLFIMCFLKIFISSLGELIGFGQFGDVFQGILNAGGEDIEVAIKTLKKGSNDMDKIKFLQEATILGQFKHPNVVTTYGMVSEQDKVRNNVKYNNIFRL